MEELQNIQFLKSLAKEAQKLSIAPNVHNAEWQKAYKFIAQGSALLWRLIEQSGQQEQFVDR